MFRQSTSLLMTALFVLGTILQGCGLQQDSGGVKPLPGGSSSAALGQEITDNGCAQMGDVDANQNYICDKAEATLQTGPEATPYDSADIPPHKRFWYQSAYTWAALGVVSAAAFVTCRDVIGQTDCSPWSPSESNTDYMSRVQTSAFLKGMSEFSTETSSVNGTPVVYVKMFNQADLKDNLFFYGKEYGSKVSFCMKAQAVLDSSKFSGNSNGTGTATLQLHIDQHPSLLTKDQEGIFESDLKDRICNEEGAWAGFERVRNNGKYYVSSLNPSSLGWKELKNTKNIKVTYVMLNFSGLNSGAGVIRLVNPDSPTVESADIPIKADTLQKMNANCSNKIGNDKTECKMRTYLNTDTQSLAINWEMVASLIRPRG